MDKIITKFCERLISSLRLNDVKFRIKLQSAGLFYGNLKEEVKAKSTLAEMNEHFLDHGINSDEENLLKLLTVMEEFDCDSLKNLARDIRKEIADGNKSGVYSEYAVQTCVLCSSVVKHMCLCFINFREKYSQNNTMYWVLVLDSKS